MMTKISAGLCLVLAVGVLASACSAQDIKNNGAASMKAWCERSRDCTVQLQDSY